MAPIQCVGTCMFMERMYECEQNSGWDSGLRHFRKVPWGWERALWLSSDLWPSCPSVWHLNRSSRSEKIGVCQAMLTSEPLLWPRMQQKSQEAPSPPGHPSRPSAFHSTLFLPTVLDFPDFLQEYRPDRQGWLFVSWATHPGRMLGSGQRRGSGV